MITIYDMGFGALGYLNSTLWVAVIIPLINTRSVLYVCSITSRSTFV